MHWMGTPAKLSIRTGNAATDAAARGWFVGHFISEELGLQRSRDVEIKWGIHKAGDERKEWVAGETRTAICISISGKHELIFRNRRVELSKQGDFVMWGKGTDHRFRTLEDGVVITVRWPSVPV